MLGIKVPLNVQIEITDKCNLFCPHCYHFDNSDGREKSSLDLDDGSVMNIAEKLIEAKVLGVILTGGEPTLRKNLMIALVSRFKQSNMYVSANTNLIAMTDHFLGELLGARIDGFLVSCPSSDPFSYNRATGGGKYQKFEDNLRILIASDAHFSINMVVNGNNLDQIRTTASRMAELGVKNFGATPMALNAECALASQLLPISDVHRIFSDLLWVEKNLGMTIDVFEALPKCLYSQEVLQANPSFISRSCQAGRTIASIACNGDVRPCSHDPRTFGNLLWEDLATIWSRMGYFRSEDLIPGACHSCAAVTRCRGGCRMNALGFNGAEGGTDPWMSSCLSEWHDQATYGRQEQEIATTTVLSFASAFRWREEEKGLYTICTNSTRNAVIVNESLLQFIFALKGMLPLSVAELEKTFRIEGNDADFLRVINNLLRREFLFV
jgi:radical SAM protein with 4Fe4S-binding SPASM domain